MYSLLRELENGEFIHIASHNSIEQLLQLKEKLRNLWPSEGRYVVRDSDGDDVDPTGI